MKDVISQSEANNSLFEPAEPKCPSRFWPGFVMGIALGIPIYPLVIPWLLRYFPSFAEAYLAWYAVYIKFVTELAGG